MRLARSLLPALAVCTGCASDGWEILGPEAREVVIELTDDAIYAASVSTDSVIFVTTFRGRIYRGVAGADVSFARVAELDDTASLWQHLLPHAVSGRTLFLTGGPQIYLWDEVEGLQRLESPARDQTASCGDYITFLQLNAIWARSATDAFVVGAHGHIYHYDGTAWSLEENELWARAPSLCSAAYDTDLRAVGGHGATVYAGAGEILARDEAGVWTKVPAPPDTGSSFFTIAIASLPSGVLFAGEFFGAFGPRIRFFRPAPGDGEWEIVGYAPPRFDRTGLSRGQAGAGGTAAFWNRYNDVIVVEGNSLTLYHLKGIADLRGALTVGRTLYAVGRIDDSSVLVRYRP